MKLLSSVQEIIFKKNINDIVYNQNSLFTKPQSNLRQKLSIDYWSMINDPPDNDSKIARNDLTQVLSLANNRTKKEIELVFLVDKDPLLLFYPYLTANKLNFQYKKFINLYTFLFAMDRDLKAFYNRARPYQIADFYGVRLDTIFTKSHHSASYPSGHTAYASLAACVLSDDHPDHSDYFWSLVNKTGEARVLQGVHFPSDNEASISFVKKVYKPLREFDKLYFL